MACHLNFPQLDPDLPASLSPRILTGLLRNQLGFEGLILTDDLDMGAIVNHYGRGNDLRLALEAGVDIPLVCHQMDSLKDAVKELENLPHGRLDDSLRRIEKARRRLKSPPQFSRERWEDINERTRALTHEIIGTDRFDPQRPSQSPVEDY